MSFQENLKNLRLKRGLSQKKLADAIGVAQSSINYWEKGERVPSVESTNRLADFFNVTLDELYDIDYSVLPISHNTTSETPNSEIKDALKKALTELDNPDIEFNKELARLITDTINTAILIAKKCTASQAAPSDQQQDQAVEADQEKKQVLK